MKMGERDFFLFIIHRNTTNWRAAKKHRLGQNVSRTSSNTPSTRVLYVIVPLYAKVISTFTSRHKTTTPRRKRAAGRPELLNWNTCMAVRSYPAPYQWPIIFWCVVRIGRSCYDLTFGIVLCLHRVCCGPTKDSNVRPGLTWCRVIWRVPLLTPWKRKV